MLTTEKLYMSFRVRGAKAGASEETCSAFVRVFL